VICLKQKIGFGVALLAAIVGAFLIYFAPHDVTDTGKGFPPVLFIAIYLPLVPVFVAAARRRRKKNNG